jgi:hypothetical protein
MNRRRIVKFVNLFLGLLIIVVSPLMWAQQAQADALNDSNSRVQAVIPLKARAFRLQDVRLLEGPFKHAMELDQKYLLLLDTDRLLHTFRLNAGLPSSAKPLGGWEEPKGELRGHSIGHYMRAAQGQGQRSRIGAGKVPGENRQRLLERIPRRIL